MILNKKQYFEPAQLFQPAPLALYALLLLNDHPASIEPTRPFLMRTVAPMRLHWPASPASAWDCAAGAEPEAGPAPSTNTFLEDHSSVLLRVPCLPFSFALVRTIAPGEVDDDAGCLGKARDVAGVHVPEHLKLVRLERVGYGGIVGDEPVPHGNLQQPPHEIEVPVPPIDDLHPGSPVPGGQV